MITYTDSIMSQISCRETITHLEPTKKELLCKKGEKVGMNKEKLLLSKKLNQKF